MNKLIIGASVVALMAVPALAWQVGEHHGPKGPTTRAEVQAKVQERFAKADTNKDGAITQAEFDAHRAAMKAEWEGKRAEHRAEMFAKLDSDKNGQLSKAEFSAPRPDLGEGRGKGEHRHMGGHHRMGGMGGGMMGMMSDDWFNRADANKDGKVTFAEASAQALAHFDKADTNKDGTLTPEERKSAWEAMRAEWKAKLG
jgi:Ca2+-binding EF-hand superfamily protein